jgi:hypothetical protein
MAQDSADTSHDEAEAMFNLSTSVGAASFDLTCTNRSSEKEQFRRSVNRAEL